MLKLTDFINKKKKVKNLIYDPCCNNCINGKLVYINNNPLAIESIECLFEKNIEHKFDYICDFYERDEVFIEYNKNLESKK